MQAAAIVPVYVLYGKGKRCRKTVKLTNGVPVPGFPLHQQPHRGADVFLARLARLELQQLLVRVQVGSQYPESSAAKYLVVWSTWCTLPAGRAP